MTDKEIVKIVKSFRKGIIGKRSPLKMCFEVCAPLSTFMKLYGCENKLTEGEIHLGKYNRGITINHFWLTLEDKRIIDPTASQFNGMGNENMPDVFLGVKPKWYKKPTSVPS